MKWQENHLVIPLLQHVIFFRPVMHTSVGNNLLRLVESVLSPDF